MGNSPAGNKPSNARYDDMAAFYDALKELESEAIVELRNRIWPSLKRRGSECGVSVPDLEEIAHDALVIALEKIANGTFQFEQTDPAAYAAVIAHNLFRNFLRKKHRHTDSLDDWDTRADDDVEKFLDSKDLRHQIDAFLNKMPENCQNLIRLRYFDELEDKEILARKLTTYTTLDSLRNKRCGCLKKLALLMDGYKQQLLEP